MTRMKTASSWLMYIASITGAGYALGLAAHHVAG
jgi:hypothetical protein